MKKIQGKTAYWGNHTFKAEADKIDGKDVTRLDIYRNVPKKWEASYFFKTKKQLKDLSVDVNSAFKSYSGDLTKFRNCRVEVDGKYQYDKKLAVDLFLECFKIVA